MDLVKSKRRIVIEVGGGEHGIESARDRKGDKWLREEGFEVLRIWDNDVLKNIEGVLEVIRAKFYYPLPQSS